jgi:brefeldin A-inhibited guanine nucleotide-exchange protein
MQVFAERYYMDNPTSLKDCDAVHTLSFALIMLNTDAHNDLVKNKMTFAQFVSNNRGINSGENVPLPLLETLYAAILTEEIKMTGSTPGAQVLVA